MDDGFEVIISQPNPVDPSEDLTYTGFILGASTIEVEPELSPIQKEILADLDFTVLKCKLDKPLNKDESRWFRWEFNSVRTSLNRPDLVTTFYLFLLNELQYTFEIVGPIDARNKFKDSLKTYWRESFKGSTSILDVASSKLISKYITNGFEKKSCGINIQDWRVYIFPGKYKGLQDLTVRADVISSGNPLGIIIPSGAKSSHRKVYMFKSGARNLKSQKILPLFTINFVTEKTNRLLVILTWLAFILSIIALYKSLK